MVRENDKIISGIMTGPLIVNTRNKNDKLDIDLLDNKKGCSFDESEEQLIRIIESNYNPKTKKPNNLNPIETVMYDLFISSEDRNSVDIKLKIYRETMSKVIKRGQISALEKRRVKNREKFKKINPLFEIVAKNVISLFNNEEIIAKLSDCNTLYDVKLLLFIDENLSCYENGTQRYDILKKLKTSSLEELARYSFKLKMWS